MAEAPLSPPSPSRTVPAHHLEPIGSTASEQRIVAAVAAVRNEILAQVAALQASVEQLSQRVAASPAVTEPTTPTIARGRDLGMELLEQGWNTSPSDASGEPAVSLGPMSDADTGGAVKRCMSSRLELPAAASVVETSAPAEEACCSSSTSEAPAAALATDDHHQSKQSRRVSYEEFSTGTDRTWMPNDLNGSELAFGDRRSESMHRRSRSGSVAFSLDEATKQPTRRPSVSSPHFGINDERDVVVPEPRRRSSSLLQRRRSRARSPPTCIAPVHVVETPRLFISRIGSSSVCSETDADRRDSSASISLAAAISGRRMSRVHALDNATALQVSETGDVDRLITSLRLHSQPHDRRQDDMYADLKRRLQSSFSTHITRGSLSETMMAPPPKPSASTETNNHPGRTWMTPPDAQWRLCWGGATLAFAMFSSIASPMLIAWSTDGYVSEGNETAGDGSAEGGGRACTFALEATAWAEAMLDVWFVLTIGVTFRTGVMVDGLMQLRPAVVTKLYVRGWLPIDVLAALPVHALASAVTSEPLCSNTLQGFRMLKFLRVLQVVREIEVLARVAKFNPSALRILKLVCGILLLWHWAACLWWFIATSTPPEAIWKINGSDPSVLSLAASREDPWGPTTALLAQSMTSQYLYALFWSVNVLTGLGSVEAPTSDVATAFHTMLLVLKIFINAVIISQFTSTIANMDASSVQKRRKLDALLEYMRSRGVPLDLRKRISGYFEFLWARVQSLDEKELMSELPTPLQLQLALVLNKSLFTRVPIFRDMEAKCIVAFVRHLHPLVSLPNQLVVQQGSTSCALCFILQGAMKVTECSVPTDAPAGRGGGIFKKVSERRMSRSVFPASETDANVVATDLLLANDFFGHESVVHDTPSPYFVRSLAYTELSALHHRDYKHVILRFPHLQELVEQHAENAKARRELCEALAQHKAAKKTQAAQNAGLRRCTFARMSVARMSVTRSVASGVDSSRRHSGVGAISSTSVFGRSRASIVPGGGNAAARRDTVISGGLGRRRTTILRTGIKLRNSSTDGSDGGSNKRWSNGSSSTNTSSPSPAEQPKDVAVTTSLANLGSSASTKQHEQLPSSTRTEAR